jgi:hypothetical protein
MIQPDQAGIKSGSTDNEGRLQKVGKKRVSCSKKTNRDTHSCSFEAETKNPKEKIRVRK